ncbi:hypothetical protein FRC10_009336 [Ceratobasidium sp. 414]|nr:hypothetical protein FRC10_009336 [Ceratobasidium sp. 414]
MALGTKGNGSSILQLHSRFVLKGKVESMEERIQKMAGIICALDDGVKEQDVVAAEADATRHTGHFGINEAPHMVSHPC